MKGFTILFVLLCSQIIHAQDYNLFKRELFIKETDTLPYRILFPENYDASKKYPLVIFLHGSGERGNDNEKQLIHGAKLFLADSNRKKYPAIVVFPQCPKNGFWSNQQLKQGVDGKAFRYFPLDEPPTKAMSMLMGLLDEILSWKSVKSKQVYVGGLSMGGMGTFELVQRRPKVFAAAFPICGGGNPATSRIMRKTRWWVFHGAKDDVVLPEYSTAMVESLKAAGANVKFTLYPEANHNSWDPAFAEPGLFPWLFSKN